MKKFLICFLALFVLVSCSEFQRKDSPGHVYIIGVGVDYFNFSGQKVNYYFTGFGNDGSLEPYREQNRITHLPCCREDVKDVTSSLATIYSAKGIDFTNFCFSQEEKSSSPLYPSVENLERVLLSINPSEDDLIVFFYSGHGVFIENKGKSYFILSDDSKLQLLPVEDVLSALDAKGCNAVAIFDDCYTGADYNNDTIVNKALLDSLTQDFDFSRLAVVASSSQEETSGSGMDNSVYTRYLLAALGWDYSSDEQVVIPSSLTVSQLFRSIKRVWPYKYQTPEMNSTTIDIVIVPDN